MKQTPKSMSPGVALPYRRRCRTSGCDGAGTGHRRPSETTAHQPRGDSPPIAARNAAVRFGAGRAAGVALGERLTNWANVSSGHRGDVKDAALIDAAWRRIGPQHQMLLRMHYIWHANRAFICRRLNIRHRPWHVFEDELEQAKTEVADALADSGCASQSA